MASLIKFFDVAFEPSLHGGSSVTPSGEGILPTTGMMMSLNQRVDDLAEGGANSETDGQIHYVALHCEFFRLARKTHCRSLLN
jgi:hypothetical protein